MNDFDNEDDFDEEFDFGAVLDEELLDELESQDFLNSRKSYDDRSPRFLTTPKIDANWVIPAILIFIIFLTILLYASR